MYKSYKSTGSAGIPGRRASGEGRLTEARRPGMPALPGIFLRRI